MSSYVVLLLNRGSAPSPSLSPSVVIVNSFYGNIICDGREIVNMLIAKTAGEEGEDELFRREKLKES